MSGETTIRTASQWLAHWATITPDRPALVIEGQGSFRYAEWAIAVAQMARHLREIGVRPGMLVGIETADHYLHAVTILGAETAGAHTLSFSAHEILNGDAAISHCEWLLHASDAAPILPPGRTSRLDRGFAAQVTQIVLTSDDVRALQHPRDPQAVVRVVRRSGTTGARKAVGYTGAILDSMLRAEASIGQNNGRDCAIILFYDFASTAGYRYMLTALYNGRPLYMIQPASFGRVIEALPSFHVTAVQGQLPDIIGAYTNNFHFAPQRSIHIVGATVPADIWAQLTPQRFGYASNGYAPSEALRVAYSSFGAPYTLYDDAEMRIVDTDGTPVAPGESGLIEVRNPRMVSGYLWDPDLTAHHFVDGWFRTFDIGHMPTPRTLIVSGRADDMLNIGGIKIMPGPFEARLRSVPGVKDVVLLAMPDRNNISRMHVVIESEKPTLDTALAATIRDTLGDTGFDFFLHCRTEFPRTETGKVQRNALRDMYAPV